MKMIGTQASSYGRCHRGCCTVFGKPCKRNLQPRKRTLKRREKLAWQKESSS